MIRCTNPALGNFQIYLNQSTQLKRCQFDGLKMICLNVLEQKIIPEVRQPWQSVTVFKNVTHPRMKSVSPAPSIQRNTFLTMS